MTTFNLAASFVPNKTRYSQLLLGITAGLMAIALFTKGGFHHSTQIAKPILHAVSAPPLQVKYLGYITQGTTRWGIILLPNGHVSDVQVGKKLRGDFFTVLSITPTTLAFVDEMGGHYVVKR